MKAREIVIFEIFMEFLLEGFILIFQELDFLFESTNLFLELIVGALEFLYPDGLDKNVFVLLWSKLLEKFVIELIFHKLVFIN